MNQVALRDGVHSDTCHFYLEFLENTRVPRLRWRHQCTTWIGCV